MKGLLFSLYVIFLVAACNDPNVVDPIDNDPVDDPVDTTEMDPVDTKLLEIKSKWEGDYIGTVSVYEYYPNKPSTYDTFYNQKITVSGFNRDSVFLSHINVSLIYNESYKDSLFYGSEEALLSDSVALFRWPAFGHSILNITLNHRDSTLVRDASYGPSPDRGSVLKGYYKRK